MYLIRKEMASAGGVLHFAFGVSARNSFDCCEIFVCSPGRPTRGEDGLLTTEYDRWCCFGHGTRGLLVCYEAFMIKYDMIISFLLSKVLSPTRYKVLPKYSLARSSLQKHSYKSMMGI